MDEYYLEIAINLARKAYRKNEVPVGAVIVKDNKILSTAFNKKNGSKRTINHAEIIAICKANKKLKDWRLNGCIMYVSLKPCEMCMGAIKEARIDRVVYACEGDYKMCDVECVCAKKDISNKSSMILKKFFEERR